MGLVRNREQWTGANINDGKIQIDMPVDPSKATSSDPHKSYWIVLKTWLQSLAGGVGTITTDATLQGDGSSGNPLTVKGASLSTIDFDAITLDTCGYYDTETISSDTDVIFESSGHVEGVWQKIKLNITTAILTFNGNVNFDSNITFVNGVTSLNGTYFLWMLYLGGELHVTLQSITDFTLTSMALLLDYTVPQYAYKSAASGVTFGNASTDSPFSVSFDCSLNDISANQRVVQVGYVAGSTYWWVIQMKSTGTFQFTLYDSTSGNAIYTTTDTTFSFGSKHKVVCTYDGSGLNSGLNVYVDGALQASTDGTAGTYVAMHGDDGNQTLTIGGYGTVGFEFPCDGLIDNVAIWNAELDLTDVTELYNSGEVFDVKTHTKYAANCNSLFEFENVLTDSKGSNNLTGQGSPTYGNL